jgi:hypothetical protein
MYSSTKLQKNREKSELIIIRLKPPLNRQIYFSSQKVTPPMWEKTPIVGYSDLLTISLAVVPAGSSRVSDS